MLYTEKFFRVSSLAILVNIPSLYVVEIRSFVSLGIASDFLLVRQFLFIKIVHEVQTGRKRQAKAKHL